MGKKIELSVDPSYVQNWGVWEAIRELIQNALDRRDQGSEMKIEYVKKSKKLRVITKGNPLERKALLLGHTTKRDDDEQRGNHGEGLKLAMLVLPRFGLSVWIKSGSERWAPELGHSSTFDTEILKVDVASVKHFDGVEVQVRNLSVEDWEIVKSRVLYFDKRLEKKKDPYNFYGRVLEGEKYVNKLFVGGLFVQELPDNYKTGFDFRPGRISLDRDRSLADPWQLRYNIRSLMRSLVDNKHVEVTEVYDMLEQHGGESTAFEDDFSLRMGFHDEIAKEFKERHGEDAIPVSSIGEADVVGHLGLRGVQVTPGLKNVIEIAEGTLDIRRQSIERSPKSIVQYGDLDDSEKILLRIAVNLVNDVDDKCNLNVLQVVEFHDEGLAATIEGGFIRVARWLLSDFDELVITLVHEIAHLHGGDAEPDHHARGEKLAGGIIGNMARMLYPHAFPKEESE